MKKKTIVIKYGGNAMTDIVIKNQLLENISSLIKKSIHIIIVHGGGPFIQKALEQAKITSEFIEGHRKTSEDALIEVEKVLKGNVNGDLVKILNRNNCKAVGLSGKDGKTVIAKKRYHITTNNQSIDLGQVGDVEYVNPNLIKLLADNDYTPVITCIASDTSGIDYNINADNFAGHIAGALKADEFLVLTDVDGLLNDINNPDSLIERIQTTSLNKLYKEGIIKGGMIPKLEACKTALINGAVSCRIINGTKPNQLLEVFEGKNIGTQIIK